MSPIAIDMSDDLPTFPASTSTKPITQSATSSFLAHTGPNANSDEIIVISSMDRMDEYQALLKDLREGGNGVVRGEMLDRILDGATKLPTQPISAIHILLPPTLLSTSTSSSTTNLLASLPPLTSTIIHLPSSDAANTRAEIQSLFTGAGYTSSADSTQSDSNTLTFQSPSRPIDAQPIASSSSTPTPTGTVKLRRSKPSSRTTKSLLWAAHSPALVDPTSLLTESDKARPECIIPSAQDSDASGKPIKRRRACKDCTCGLKELELQEAESGRVVADGGDPNLTTGIDGVAPAPAPTPQAFFLEGDDDIPTHIKLATLGVESVWPEDKRAEAKKTSSCGSCYLGDAFRCGSCPYLGELFV